MPFGYPNNKNGFWFQLWNENSINPKIVTVGTRYYPTEGEARAAAAQFKNASAATGQFGQKTAANKPGYVIFPENDTNGILKYWFRLEDGTGTKLGKSQGYTTKAGAEEGVKDAKTLAAKSVP
jgi:uncharacterized protein YegP (UPF0339 family)